MKKIWICAGFFLLAATAEAQLLKKLKDKAQKVLEPSKPDNAKTGETQGNTGSGTSKGSAKKDWIDTTACKVIFTLNGASGETLLYDETSVVAKDNKLSYAFVVTNKKYEYFLIEDGQRSGPHREPKLPSMKQTDDAEEGGGSSNDDMNIGGEKKDPVAIQYSKTIGGKLYLVFNGKNFGPYDNVAKMVVSPDKKKFFAVVTIGGANAMTAKMGMGNNFLVNEAALKQKMGGSNTIPMKMKVSSGFKAAMATLMDNETQKALTVSSTGRRTDTDLTDLYSGNNGLNMVSDAGDLISVPSQSPTQILVNGEEAASFKVPVTHTSRLFLLPDIKKSVYYEKGKLYRGDGSVEDVAYITFPKVVTLNGESAVYYYKMRKNEAGDTEVFLCKKAL